MNTAEMSVMEACCGKAEKPSRTATPSSRDRRNGSAKCQPRVISCPDRSAPEETPTVRAIKNRPECAGDRPRAICRK